MILLRVARALGCGLAARIFSREQSAVFRRTLPRGKLRPKSEKKRVFRGPEWENFSGFVVYFDGTKRWFFGGKLHKIDGPAIEYANGTKFWYVDGKRHRLDGPAGERSDGTKFWFVDGKQHYTNKSFQVAAKLSDEYMTVLILKYGNMK